MRSFQRENKPFFRNTRTRQTSRSADRPRRFGRDSERSDQPRKFGRDSERSDPPRRFHRDSESPERRYNPERSGFQSERRDAGFRKEMHAAICAQCGSECEVPFRPSSGKPVYCSNCFQRGNTSESEKADNIQKQIDDINRKLDKIMRALKI